MIISVEIMENFVKDSIFTPPTIGSCRFTILFHVKHYLEDTHQLPQPIVAPFHYMLIYQQ